METMEGFEFCRPYLAENEYVLWKGRPEKGNLFTGREMVILPFAVMWLAFALYWEYQAFQGVGSWFAILWGLPFVAVGIYLLAGRFAAAAYLRGRTFYVITNKKIIIKKGGRIVMYDGKSLPPMNLVIHKNGNGTLTFGHQIYTRNGYRSSVSFTIENIPDVVQVQNALEMMER